MSSTTEPHTHHYSRIRQNPRYIALARARSRTTWILSALVLAAYFLFMALAACRPDLLHLPLYAGSHLSLGLPLGALLILACWLLTGWYVHRANTHYDSLSEQIVKESQA
ncbi:Inner membrane protein YjcH [compost metagenome]